MSCIIRGGGDGDVELVAARAAGAARDVDSDGEGDRFSLDVALVYAMSFRGDDLLGVDAEGRGRFGGEMLRCMCDCDAAAAAEGSGAGGDGEAEGERLTFANNDGRTAAIDVVEEGMLAAAVFVRAIDCLAGGVVVLTAAVVELKDGDGERAMNALNVRASTADGLTVAAAAVVTHPPIGVCDCCRMMSIASASTSSALFIAAHCNTCASAFAR